MIAIEHDDGYDDDNDGDDKDEDHYLCHADMIEHTVTNFILIRKQ